MPHGRSGCARDSWKGIHCPPLRTRRERTRGEIFDDDMAHVRENMRKPVTDLWQMDEPRARTAPARVAGCTAASTFLGHSPVKSSRWPQTESGSNRGRAKSRTRLGNDRHAREAISGGRGEVLGALGIPKDGGASAANQPLNQDETHALSETPVFESAEVVAVARLSPMSERRTSMPLRSSHRVGPIGTLGRYSRIKREIHPPIC